MGGAPETGPDSGADETAAIPTAAAWTGDCRTQIRGTIMAINIWPLASSVKCFFHFPEAFLHHKSNHVDMSAELKMWHNDPSIFLRFIELNQETAPIQLGVAKMAEEFKLIYSPSMYWKKYVHFKHLQASFTLACMLSTTSFTGGRRSESNRPPFLLPLFNSCPDLLTAAL